MSIPRPDNGTEWVYMNSNTVYLNATEISYLSTENVKIALYEMYARHGCIFLDSEIAAYFNSLSWYTGTIGENFFDTSVFNDIEKWNVDLLKKEASGRGIRIPGDMTARPSNYSSTNASSSSSVTRPATGGSVRRPTTGGSVSRPTTGGSGRR